MGQPYFSICISDTVDMRDDFAILVLGQDLYFAVDC
jgi:hypothetical protein